MIVGTLERWIKLVLVSFYLFLSSLKVKSQFLLMEFGGFKESNTRNLFWFWSFRFKDTIWNTIMNVSIDVQTREIHPQVDEDNDSHDPTRRTTFVSLAIERDVVAEMTFYHKTNWDFLPSALWKPRCYLFQGSSATLRGYPSSLLKIFLPYSHEQREKNHSYRWFWC